MLPAETFLKNIEAAAPTFDVRSIGIPIRNVSELEASINNISRELGEGSCRSRTPTLQRIVICALRLAHVSRCPRSLQIMHSR